MELFIHVSADLMGLELGVIKFLDRVLHVLVAHKLHNSCAVMEHIRITDVTGLTHVVLQILPAASRWETCGDQQHIPDEMAIQTHKPVPDKTRESRLITVKSQAFWVSCFRIQNSEKTAIPDCGMQSVIRIAVRRHHFKTVRHIQIFIQFCTLF